MQVPLLFKLNYFISLIYMSSNTFWFSNNGVELVSIHPINGITINNTSDNALNVLGGVSISNGVTIGGNITISGSVVTTSTSGQTLSNLTITDSTVASNYTTGSILNYGGITINNTSNPIGLGSGGTLLSRGGASFDKDLFVGGVLNTVSLSSGNVTVINLTTSSIVTNNISSSSISVTDTNSTNVSSGNANIANLTTANIVVTDVSSTNITTVSLISSKITSSNVSVTNLNYVNLTTSTLNINSLTTGNAIITNLNSTNMSSATVNLTGLTGVSALITNLDNVNLTTDSLIGTNISTVSLISSNLTTSNAVITNLSSTNICSGNTSTISLSVSGSSSSVGSIITTGGNVGIATTTPSKRLHVNGDVLVSDLTTGNLNFTGTLYNNGVSFVGSSSQWNTSGSNIFFSSGNVGIGTSNPAQRLVVSSNPISNSVEMQIFNNSFTSANLTLGVPSQAGNIITNALTGGSVVCNDFGPLQLGARNSTGSATGYIFIQTGGNVGISTTAPSKALHVNGEVLVNNLTTGNIYSTGTIRYLNSSIANLRISGSASITSLNSLSIPGANWSAPVFYTEQGSISASGTGIYYISPTIQGIGKLTVTMNNPANTIGTLWVSYGDIILNGYSNNQLRPNLSNIIELDHGTGITASLEPFGGVNSTSIVTDSPANSVRLNITSLTGTWTIDWVLFIQQEF
jgi:uncharacterized protein YjbI with pentapeptide repeats